MSLGIRCILLVALLAGGWLTPHSASAAYTAAQVAKAEARWMEASGWVLAKRRANRSWQENLDPALSGLVGHEEGVFTTSLGQLEAKQSAAQSGWCRVIACLLDSLQVDEKDTVAVTMTGSFPGLNLAVLLTLEAGGIPYRCISSLGASTFGANDSTFNWPLVEGWLRQRRLLRTGSLAITPGGSGDRLNGHELDAMRAAEEALRPHKASLHPASLQQAVELSRELLGPRPSLSLLVNVGGSHPVLGGNDFGRQMPGGLLGEGSSSPAQAGDEAGTVGVMQLYWQEGLPILHFSDIVRLAREWGLPAPPQEAASPAELVRDCQRPRAKPAQKPVTKGKRKP